LFNIKISVLGFGEDARTRLASWIQIANTACQEPDPAPPPMKEFKPKFDLPKLQNYKAPATRDFWEKFPSRQFTAAKSLYIYVYLQP
jgi:hypothetical protein